MKTLCQKFIKLKRNTIMKIELPNIMLSLINNFLECIIYRPNYGLIICQDISNICRFSSWCELLLLKLRKRDEMFVPLQYNTNSIFILEFIITELVLANHALKFYSSSVAQPC